MILPSFAARQNVFFLPLNNPQQKANLAFSTWAHQLVQHCEMLSSLLWFGHLEKLLLEAAVKHDKVVLHFCALRSLL